MNKGTLSHNIYKIQEKCLKKHRYHIDENMSILSKIITTVSILQLLHSGYSVYEFNEVNKQLGLTALSTTDFLPLDIKYEIICSLVLFTVGVFLSVEKTTYSPLSSSKSTSTGEYLQPIVMNEATKLDNLQELDPYGNVNNTPFIVDILAKRKEFQDWEAKNSRKK